MSASAARLVAGVHGRFTEDFNTPAAKVLIEEVRA
jgi:hypothetical protein